jgi:long-chain acyl-CoA synthetase
MSIPLIDKKIKNLNDFFEKNVQKYANKPAYHCLGKTITFKDVDDESYALACWLQQNTNLVPGDRIAIQLPNIIQYLIAVYAALRAGFIVVNTNPQYTSREMQHQFKDSGAKAIIILDDLIPQLEEIKAKTNLEHVITTSINDLTNNHTENRSGYTCFNQAIKQGQSLHLKPIKEINLDDACVLQYTGGTTGVSKAAVLTHRNILSNSAQVKNRLHADSNDIYVCPLPLYHIYAFTLHLVLFFGQGGLSILIPNPRDMSQLVNSIKQFKFTGFAGINTLFVGLCQHPEFKTLDFSSLRLTISGGAALTPSAIEDWKRVTNCSITEGYGLSETSPVLCLNQPQKEEYGSVGLPINDTEINIVNEDNQTVDDGCTGEIVARGPQVMSHYWQRPDETAKVMTEDGFFKTVDIGLKLPSGCIQIVDRLKDMIIVSGFNVYPNEIEAVLVNHPDIIESAVIGKPDDKTGEKVTCFITIKNELSADEVIKHCKVNLTAYKIPKEVNIVAELPKSSVGKILRRNLR